MLVLLKDTGVLDGHIPATEFTHAGAEFEMLCMQRRFFHDPRTLDKHPCHRNRNLIPLTTQRGIAVP